MDYDSPVSSADTYLLARSLRAAKKFHLRPITNFLGNGSLNPDRYKLGETKPRALRYVWPCFKPFPLSHTGCPSVTNSVALLLLSLLAGHPWHEGTRELLEA